MSFWFIFLLQYTTTVSPFLGTFFVATPIFPGCRTEVWLSSAPVSVTVRRMDEVLRYMYWIMCILVSGSESVFVRKLWRWTVSVPVWPRNTCYKWPSSSSQMTQAKTGIFHSVPGDCRIWMTSLWPSSPRSLALSSGVLPSSSRRSGLAPYRSRV